MHSVQSASWWCDLASLLGVSMCDAAVSLLGGQVTCMTSKTWSLDFGFRYQPSTDQCSTKVMGHWTTSLDESCYRAVNLSHVTQYRRDYFSSECSGGEPCHVSSLVSHVYPVSFKWTVWDGLQAWWFNWARSLNWSTCAIHTNRETLLSAWWRLCEHLPQKRSSLSAELTTV